MLAGLEALRHMSRACHAALPPAAVEVMLGFVTYGGHVANGLDLNAVKSMANFIAAEQVEMVSLLFHFVLFCVFCPVLTVELSFLCYTHTELTTTELKRATTE